MLASVLALVLAHIAGFDAVLSCAVLSYVIAAAALPMNAFGDANVGL